MTQVPQYLRALCLEAARPCCIARALVVLVGDYLQTEIVKGSFFFLSLETLATGTTFMEANQYPA